MAIVGSVALDQAEALTFSGIQEMADALPQQENDQLGIALAAYCEAAWADGVGKLFDKE